MLFWGRDSACRGSIAAVVVPRKVYLLLLLATVMIFTHPETTDAATLNVNPEGDNAFTLTEAMAFAEPGDVIRLQDGSYDSRLESVIGGESGNPITVIGGAGAVIRTSSSPAVRIKHSYIHLTGFTVDGYFGSSHDVDSYTNKCVWIDGEGDDDSVNYIQGFVMRNMFIQNCGSECVRLKNFVTGAIIAGNTIKDCGVYDYELDEGHKNGEAIYVGTSSNQWTHGEDSCSFNYISGNIIETNANECVDIKEGSSGNVVERNVCSNQLDEDSACFNSRGDGNTFRFNEAIDCIGAGVRVGGWNVDGYQFGHSNNIYGNQIVNAGYGSLKIEIEGQGLICGNLCEDGECAVRGEDTDIIGATAFESCPSDDFSNVMETTPALSLTSTQSSAGDSYDSGSNGDTIGVDTNRDDDDDSDDVDNGDNDDEDDEDDDDDDDDA